MDTFADYILSEKDLIRKMEIVHYLQKKSNIFYDNSVILKTEIAKMFIETMNIDVDKNLVLTACLLYACKKVNNSKNLEDIRGYSKNSAEYLQTLGFSDEFCTICRQHNRYTEEEPRKKEADILELVDNFGGMIIDRPERPAYSVEEAIYLMENRNLKNKKNRYLKEFKEFVGKAEEIKI